jgi:hypothetical protein
MIRCAGPVPDLRFLAHRDFRPLAEQPDGFSLNIASKILVNELGGVHVDARYAQAVAGHQPTLRSGPRVSLVCVVMDYR